MHACTHTHTHAHACTHTHTHTHTHLVEGDKLCIDTNKISMGGELMQGKRGECDWRLNKTRAMSLYQQYCRIKLAFDCVYGCGGRVSWTYWCREAYTN